MGTVGRRGKIVVHQVVIRLGLCQKGRGVIQIFEQVGRGFFGLQLERGCGHGSGRDGGSNRRGRTARDGGFSAVGRGDVDAGGHEAAAADLERLTDGRTEGELEGASALDVAGE